MSKSFIDEDKNIEEKNVSPIVAKLSGENKNKIKAYTRLMSNKIKACTFRLRHVENSLSCSSLNVFCVKVSALKPKNSKRQRDETSCREIVDVATADARFSPDGDFSVWASNREKNKRQIQWKHCSNPSERYCNVTGRKTSLSLTHEISS